MELVSFSYQKVMVEAVKPSNKENNALLVYWTKAKENYRWVS